MIIEPQVFIGPAWAENRSEMEAVKFITDYHFYHERRASRSYETQLD